MKKGIKYKRNNVPVVFCRKTEDRMTQIKVRRQLIHSA